MDYLREGEVIALEYSECDREGEGSALYLARLNNVNLGAIFNPCSCVEASNLDEKVMFWSVGEYVTPTEYAIRVLKRKRVEEVITLCGFGQFCGLELNRPVDDVDNFDMWTEFQGLTPETYLSNCLLHNGIRIRYFDFSIKEFIEV